MEPLCSRILWNTIRIDDRKIPMRRFDRWVYIPIGRRFRKTRATSWVGYNRLFLWNKYLGRVRYGLPDSREQAMLCRAIRVWQNIWDRTTICRNIGAGRHVPIRLVVSCKPVWRWALVFSSCFFRIDDRDKFLGECWYGEAVFDRFQSVLFHLRQMPCLSQ